MNPPAPADTRYDVFISYSTDPDYNLSRRVESFLESFHKLKLLSGHQLKPLRVCRDGSDFSLHRLRQQASGVAQATDEVQQVLAEYLSRSEYLLVLCSGSAARSAYVGYEVEWFIRNRGADKVLLAVTEGADRSGDLTGLFPKPALDSQLHQRIFYDLRGFKPEAKHWVKVRNYEEELTRLAADLNGETLGDILPSWQQEELRRLRRQRYAVGAAAVVLLALAVVAGIQWFRATRSRAEARNQLARNYWGNAHAALDANDPLKFAHLLGQAAATSEDSLLTQDVLLDGQALRPCYQLAAILGHDLLGAAISPDYSRVVGWNQRTVQVWQASDGQPVGPPLQRDSTASDASSSYDGVAFSPDGRQLVSWDRGGIWQWQGATNRLLVPGTRAQTLRASFSADGRYLLGESPSGVQRWRLADGQPAGPLLRPQGMTLGVVFSRDQSLALLSSDQGAQLWRLDAGQPVGKPLAGGQRAAFSPDERYFVVWNFPGVIQVGATATGQPAGQPLRYPANGRFLNGAALSPDNAQVLAWGDNGVQLWQVATGQPVSSLLRAGQRVLGACFSPDGTRVLAWGRGGMQQWLAADGQPVGQLMQHEGGPLGVVQGAAFSADGYRLLSWGGSTVRLWQAATGLPLATPLAHGGPVTQASFSPDGRRIMAWEPGGIRLWQAARYPPRQQALQGRQEPIDGLLFSPDGRRLLAYGLNGTLRLWDATANRPLGVPVAQGGRLHGARFSADGQRVLTWDFDSTLCLLDAATGQLLHRLNHPGPVNEDYDGTLDGAQFDSRSRRLASWGGDTVRLWDAATGRQLGRPFYARAAAFSRDGSCLLSWGSDGRVQLHHSATGTPLGPAMRHAGVDGTRTVYGAAFNADETSILSWGYDGIRRWQRATGQPIGPLLRLPHEVYGARLYQHEKRLLAFGPDGGLQLWQLEPPVRPVGGPLRHEKLANEIGGTGAEITGVLLSADERRLLSWGTDGVRLWQADTGQPLLPLLAMADEDNPVDSARFSRDGRRILAWGRDNSLRMWQAATGQLLPTPLPPDGAPGRLAFSPDERWLVAGGPTGQLHRWAARPDRDLPPALAALELQALTGTGFDPGTQEPYVLPAGRWRQARRAYEQQATAHYATCRYREANTWATFRLEPQ